MNKIGKFRIWQFLLASILMLLLAGCELFTPTEPPPYIHYKPSELSNVHLEFDYPSNWIYSDKREWMRIVGISLEDPRFETLPTPSPPGYHPAPNDYGYVRIWIRESKPDQTPETEVEMLKQAYSLNFNRYTILDDFEMTIDGDKASVLEYYDNEPMEYYPVLMFYRRIFFTIDNQLYEIDFTVAESERGGEFEQGYEYFFDSLKIVP